MQPIKTQGFSHMISVDLSHGGILTSDWYEFKELAKVWQCFAGWIINIGTIEPPNTVPLFTTPPPLYRCSFSSLKQAFPKLNTNSLMNSGIEGVHCNWELTFRVHNLFLEKKLTQIVFTIFSCSSDNLNKCPEGTYNPYTERDAAADCLACPEGKECTTQQLDNPLDCSAGQHLEQSPKFRQLKV